MMGEIARISQSTRVVELTPITELPSFFFNTEFRCYH